VRLQRVPAHPRPQPEIVVHHGTILRQRVAGHQELLGPDVILVHRLLKNDVLVSTGIEAYALFSQQCADPMDLGVSALGMRASSETYEHIGAVPVRVHDLGRRWQEKESRTRVIVDEREAVYGVRHADLGPAADRLGVRDNAGPADHLAAWGNRGGADRDGQPPRGQSHASGRGGAGAGAVKAAPGEVMLAAPEQRHTALSRRQLGGGAQS
jgi:Protein of unknown function (DUF2652)